MPKVEEVTVDKNRAKKQTTPGAAPVASDEKVSCSPHYLIVFILKCDCFHLEMYRETSAQSVVWTEEVDSSVSCWMFQMAKTALCGIRL